MLTSFLHSESKSLWILHTSGYIHDKVVGTVQKRNLGFFLILLNENRWNPNMFINIDQLSKMSIYDFFGQSIVYKYSAEKYFLWTLVGHDRVFLYIILLTYFQQNKKHPSSSRKKRNIKMTEFLYFKTEFHLSKTLIGIETRGKKYDLRSHRYTLTCISLFIFQFILKDFHSIWFTSCCIHTFQLCIIYSNTNAKLSVWCQSVHSVFSIFMKTFWSILSFQKT